MLRRASVADVKSGSVTKADGRVVVTMRVYPRFLPKSLVSEYVARLSPDAALFGRYRELKRASGDQDGSFEGAGYQQRFTLDDDALAELGRLAQLSKHEEVFLVCQCARTERCHVDLMLLLAERRFGAEIGKLPHEYEEFRRRLA